MVGKMRITVFQIKKGNSDYLGILCFVFFHRKIRNDPSLELSYQNGSNEGSQTYVFIDK